MNSFARRWLDTLRNNTAIAALARDTAERDRDAAISAEMTARAELDQVRAALHTAHGRHNLETAALEQQVATLRSERNTIETEVLRLRALDTRSTAQLRADNALLVDALRRREEQLAAAEGRKAAHWVEFSPTLGRLLTYEEQDRVIAAVRTEVTTRVGALA